MIVESFIGGTPLGDVIQRKASRYPKEKCTFTCRLSFEPGVKYRDVRKRVETCIREAAQKDGWLTQEPPRVEYYGFQAEGSVTDKNAELLHVLASAHQKARNEESEFNVNTGLTDMRYFNVFSGIPAANYGPSGQDIHNVDEYVDLDSIVEGAKTLALFMLDWCGYDG